MKWLLVLLLTSAAWAYPATVTAVHDGDTVTLSNGIHLRLAGIDAPELKQPGGGEAQAYLSHLILNTTVEVTPHGKDRYGRTVGEITVPAGNVNHMMVAAGMAWWYSHYAPYDTVLRDLEAGARRSHLGLWAKLNPTPPWEFRKRKK